MQSDISKSNTCPESRSNSSYHDNELLHVGQLTQPEGERGEKHELSHLIIMN